MAKEIIEFYGGKVKLEFDDVKHSFHNVKTGEKILSVTAALSMINKPLLLPWAIKTMREFLIERRKLGMSIGIPDILEASKVHDVVKTQAADKGKEVHDWIERYIKFKLGIEKEMPKQPEDEQLYNGVIAFLKWEKETKIKWVASERKIYSRKHNYAGILDIKGKIGKLHYVVDIKTGNAIYNEMRYQTSAYQEADAEETGDEYGDVRWIIRLDKNTAEFEAKPMDEHEEDFKSFLSALQLKNRDNKLSGKDKGKKPAVELPY